MMSLIEDLRILTPLQQGMLFEILAEPLKPLYVQQLIVRCARRPSKIALEAAVQRATHRCDVLRTGFVWQGVARPHQVVLSKSHVPVQFIEVASSESESWDDVVLQRERSKPFDARFPPLIKIAVICPADDDQLTTIAFTYSHLILDGWSLPLLVHDILAECFLEKQGQFSSAPFKEFLQFLESRPTHDIEFWREFLADYELSDFSLILDSEAVTRNLPKAGKTRVTERCLSEASEAHLKAIAKHLKCSPSSVALGCWLKTVSRLTHSASVACGVVLSGRDVPVANVGEGIGMFMNTLPLSAHISSGSSIQDVIIAVHARICALQSQVNTSIAQLRSLLGAEVDSAPFGSLFVYENYPLGEGDSGFGIINQELRESQHHPCTVWIIPGADSATIRVAFDSSRFPSWLIDGILEDFCQHMAIACGSFGGAEQLPVDRVVGNMGLACGETVPSVPSLCEAFLEKAKSQPQAIAIAEKNRFIDYGTFHRAVEEVAKIFRSNGVGQGVRAAILLPHSPTMLATVFAALLESVTIVPLEVTTETARLQKYLQSGGVRVVVTSTEYADNLPYGPWKVIELPDVFEKRCAVPLDLNFRVPCGDCLAYVMFTSGSTGEPKAVGITHSNLDNYVEWCKQKYVLRKGEGTQVPLMSAVDVDLSITSYIVPLALGEAVYLPAGKSIVERLSEVAGTGHRFKYIKCTPTQLRLLASLTPRNRSVAIADLLIVGGEPLLEEDLAEWVNRRSVPVVNEYGPTETTVGCACRFYECGEQGGGKVISIGTPIINTQIRIVDLGGQPVPPGFCGELIIGGQCVGRYLNETDGVPKFFKEQQDTNCVESYRSGDLGILAPDGEIILRGRRDGQVKVNGFRIELAAIDTVARSVPGCDFATSFLIENSDGTRAVGLFVPKEAPLAQVRATCAKLLSPAFQPSEIFPVPEVPAGRSGKACRLIRRAELPSSHSHERNESSPVTAGALESMILKSWQDVLGSRDISIDQNFFDIGGSSLKVLAVWNKIQPDIGASLTITDFFRHPTIRSLSDFIRSRDTSSAPGSSLEIGSGREAVPNDAISHLAKVRS